MMPGGKMKKESSAVLLRWWTEEGGRNGTHSDADKEQVAARAGVSYAQVCRFILNRRHRDRKRTAEESTPNRVAKTRKRRMEGESSDVLLQWWTEEGGRNGTHSDAEKEQVAERAGVRVAQVSRFILNHRQYETKRAKRGGCFSEPFIAAIAEEGSDVGVIEESWEEYSVAGEQLEHSNLEISVNPISWDRHIINNSISNK